ncbi:MAG: putative serine/threonine protein kinase [uncultured bacterium]|nr:MAG: putative serine/threonine protein kinase [uncultured bacterium]
MNEEINKIFQEFLAEHSDQIEIDFTPLIKTYPNYQEELNKKIAAYKRLMGIIHHQDIGDCPNLRAGQIIGGCELVRVLGQGGMGIVYLAKQVALNREVAIKVIRKMPGESRFLARFKQEAKSIAKLKHENIVQIYDVGEEEGYSYIIMDYVRGVSLDKIIKKIEEVGTEKFKEEMILSGSQSEVIEGNQLGLKTGSDFLRLCCDLMIQVCDAVSYAHEQGIIHRDIKPSNIIIDQYGKPTILDFGLSRDVNEMGMTLTGEYLGTPVYSAPELLNGAARSDILLDVYALGVVFYELITQNLPYQGQSYGELLIKITNEPPENPKKYCRKLPADINRILVKAINKDVNLRYKNVAELQNDIQNYLLNKPVIARKRSLVYLIKKWFFRNRKKIVAITVFVLLLGSFAGTHSFFKYYRLKRIISEYTVAIARGDLRNTKKKLNEAIGLAPQNSDMWALLGAVQAATGDYADSIESLLKADTILEKKEYKIQLAHMYLMEGDVNAARSLLDEVPDDDDSNSVRAFYFLSTGDIQRALKEYREQAINRTMNSDNFLLAHSEYSLPPIFRVALCYLHLNYRQLTKAYLQYGMTMFPFNKGLFGLTDSIAPHNNSNVKRHDLFDNISEYRFNKADIVIKLSKQWERYPFAVFVNDNVIAEFRRVPGTPKELILGTTVYVSRLARRNQNILDDVYAHLDEVLVKFRGNIRERQEPVTLKGHNYFKYLLDGKAYIYKKEIRAQTGVYEYDEQIYLITAFADTEKFGDYEQEFREMFNNVKFEHVKDWGKHWPPNRVYEIKLPESPVYYEIRYMGDAVALSDDVIETTLMIDPTSYGKGLITVTDVFTKKTAKSDMDSVVKYVVEKIKSTGKILNIDTTTVGDQRVAVIKYNKPGFEADLKICAHEKHVFVIDFQQFENEHKQDLADSILNSFVYNHASSEYYFTNSEEQKTAKLIQFVKNLYDKDTVQTLLKTVDLTKESAAINDVDTLWALAKAYETGEYGIPQNLQKADQIVGKLLKEVETTEKH